MKRRSQGRQKRAPAPYTKKRKTPCQYPDWIARGAKPPVGSVHHQLAEVARLRRLAYFER